MNETALIQTRLNLMLRTECRERHRPPPIILATCTFAGGKAIVKVVGILGVCIALSTFCPLDKFAGEGSDAGF